MRTDPEIRAALIPLLRETRPGALIVQEWDFLGVARADLAVVSSEGIESYEIKSAADSMSRLPRQVPLYSKVFTRCTLVTTRKRGLHALSEVVLPPWWGIVVADTASERSETPASERSETQASERSETQASERNGTQGSVGRFEVLRSAAANPSPAIHRLLWLPESKRIVKALGLQAAAQANLARRYRSHKAYTPKAPRKADYDAALATASQEELQPLVVEALLARKGWRTEDGRSVLGQEMKAARQREASRKKAARRS